MEVDTEGRRSYIKCRVEKANQQADWENCWRLARLPGLGPENVSFLSKMMHQILPTQERVARTKPKSSSSCSVPGCKNLTEDLGHALVLCEGNNGVGHRVLECLRKFVPNIDVKSALCLEIDVEEDLELPLVWMLATVFSAVWKLRIAKTKILLFEVRSTLEAKINLLRETRFSNAALKLDQIVDQFFK